jgi:hypothetical protein
MAQATNVSTITLSRFHNFADPALADASTAELGAASSTITAFSTSMGIATSRDWPPYLLVVAEPARRQIIAPGMKHRISTRSRESNFQK